MNPAHDKTIELLLERYEIPQYALDWTKKEVDVGHPEELNRLADGLNKHIDHENREEKLFAYFDHMGWKFYAVIPQKMSESRIQKRKNYL